MKNCLLFFVLTFGPISCIKKETTDTVDRSTVDTSQQQVKVDTLKQRSKKWQFDPKKIDSDLQKRIEVSEATPSGNYFKIILATDSTCKVEWGNKKLKRISSKDFYFSEARRLYFEWENKSFVALRAGRGSDAWFDAFLPLDNSSSDFTIENVLAENKEKNIIVAEYIGADTIMFMQNLLTKKIHYVLETSRCGSGFNHYCLDSIKIANGGLFYRWVLPDKLDDNCKATKRRVEVKI
jgi:hypothetical protein